MNEFLKKLSELINAKNLAYQNNRQQFADGESDTASTPDTYNPPEVNVPKTTPVSTSPVTQTNNPAVNIPKPTAKMTSNKAKVDPKIINEKNCSFPDHILYFDLGWLQKTGYFKR